MELRKQDQSEEELDAEPFYDDLTVPHDVGLHSYIENQNNVVTSCTGQVPHLVPGNDVSNNNSDATEVVETGIGNHCPVPTAQHPCGDLMPWQKPPYNNNPNSVTIGETNGPVIICSKAYVVQSYKQPVQTDDDRHYHSVTNNRASQSFPCNDLEADAEITNISSGGLATASFHRETFQKAVKTLLEKGWVILRGPPGCGKTVLGDMLLEHFRQQGYMTESVRGLCNQLLAELSNAERGTVVLMDGGLGEVRLDTERHQRCRELLFDSQKRRRFPQHLLVLTAYPHVLQELRKLEACLDCSIAEPSVVVDLEQEPMNPATTCTPTVTNCMHLLQRMVHDPVMGTVMTALLALSMLGQGNFLRDPPAVRGELKRLGFRNVSCCDLDRQASYLKGSILALSSPGFPDRTVYDCVGLVLGRFSLSVMLKVCDAKFLLEHVRTTETHSNTLHADQSSESLILEISTTEGRQSLMQRIHELIMTGHNMQELCQHPSLESLSFLEDLEKFCKRNRKKNCMISAVDSRYGLPLLYWSAFSPSPCFTHWCLKMMVEHVSNRKILAESVLATAFAAIFFSHSPHMARVQGKAFIEELIFLNFRVTSEETVHLKLPRPRSMAELQDIGNDVKTSPTSHDLCYIDEIFQKSCGLCYRDDTSLLIPAKLLLVDVADDMVTVELPGRQWELVLRLLTDRAVDEVDQKGNTLLHIAVITGHADAIGLAIKTGASLTVKNSKGLTPYHLSVKRQGKARNRKVDTSGKLHVACRNCDLETINWLLCHCSTLKDRGDKDDTPLHSACKEGHAQLASHFVELDNAQVNSKNKCQQTPLHLACRFGHLDIVKMLVGNGACINVKAQSMSPLHVASSWGYTEIVDFLIHHHADVNVRGYCGRSELHEAVIEGHLAVAHRLLQHNANVNSKDGWGHSPLHHACAASCEDMVKLLLDHGADVCAKNDRGLLPVQLAPDKCRGNLVSLLQNYCAAKGVPANMCV